MSKRCIQSLRATYHPLPLKNPFVISIRSATHANVIRWELKTDDGEVYLGESVPVQYVTGETPDSVLAVAPKIAAEVRGASVAEIEDSIRVLAQAFPSDVAARAGVEIALYSAFANELGVSVRSLFGASNVTLETDLTIARIPNSLAVAQAAWLEGFRIFKIKVGGGEMSEDVERILAIANALPGAVLRLDANQSLTVATTLALTDTLLRGGANIEVIEQPVPKEDIVALDEIARSSPVPIIADESCRTATDAERLFSETAVHGVNVKLMKCGFAGALEITRIAMEEGKKLMIGCMLESEVGMAASVALACGTGAFDYVDLDGHLLLDLARPVELFHAEGPMIRSLG